MIDFVQCFLRFAKVVRWSTEDPDAWLPLDGELERTLLLRGDGDRAKREGEGEQISM